MRVLFVGNSHFSALKLALDASPSIFEGIEPYFYIFPGGSGPSFVIDEKLLLQPIAAYINPKFPVRASPEATRELPLNYYDAVVIGALGNIDAGFYYNVSPIMTQGVLYEFGPKQNELTERLISKSCLIHAMRGLFQKQHGFQLLTNLRKHTSVPIIVQPFPRRSTIVRDHPNWAMNKLYSDPLGAYRFYTNACNELLAQACTEAQALLLPLPEIASEDPLFNPADMMSPVDGIHGLAAYGELVLRQLAETFRRLA